jgi:hypothetical protein
MCTDYLIRNLHYRAANINVECCAVRWMALPHEGVEVLTLLVKNCGKKSRTCPLVLLSRKQRGDNFWGIASMIFAICRNQNFGPHHAPIVLVYGSIFPPKYYLKRGNRFPGAILLFFKKRVNINPVSPDRAYLNKSSNCQHQSAFHNLPSYYI